MIQQFLTNLKVAFSFKNKTQKSIILIALVFFYFAYNYQIEVSKIETIVDYVINFSGIFSAILITYIITKSFQIRQERLLHKDDIIFLSNKITDFRRIARILKDSTRFWDSTMKSKLENEYKQIDYFDLHNSSPDFREKYPEKAKLIDKYIEDQSTIGGNFYLALKSIVLDHKNRWQLDLFDTYDNQKTYNLKILSKWINYSSMGALWYNFDHKYHEIQHCVKLTEVFKSDQEEILYLCSKINPIEFKNKEFTNDTLAQVGNEINSSILPKLHSITYECTRKLPKIINYLITILYLSIFFGIILPLFCVSFNFSYNIRVFLIYTSLLVTVLSMMYFMLTFKKTLKKDIKVLGNDKTYH